MVSGSHIYLNRLAVRSDAKTARLLVGELENAHWQGAEHEWLFVRRLAVKSPANQVNRHLKQELQQLALSAVAGQYAQPGDQAIRFSSLSQMLAYLIRDILGGHWTQRWYWHQWWHLTGQPKGNIIAQVLWQHTEALASVTQQLMAMNRLVHVWRTLPESAAGQLYVHIQQDARQVPLVELEPIEKQRQLRSFTHQVAQSAEAHAQLIRQWREALDGHPPQSFHVRLAVAIVARQLWANGWQQFPLVIEAAVHKLLVPSVISVAVVPSSPHKDHLPLVDPKPNQPDYNAEAKSNRTLSKHSEKNQDAGLITQSNPSHAVSPSNRQANSDSQPAKTPTTHRVGVQQSRQRHALPVEPKPDLAAPEHAIQSVPQQGGALEWQGQSFVTTQGGFFYLINLLSHPYCQTCLQRQEQQNIWLILFDVMRQLGGEPDAPLTAFLAIQAGVDRQCLLDLPQQSTLLPVMNFIQRQAKWLPVLNKSLFSEPAKVVADESHIHVYLSLSSVRLEVRLAGLDKDPAWVPWLGRVVRFYFQPEPVIPESQNDP